MSEADKRYCVFPRRTAIHIRDPLGGRWTYCGLDAHPAHEWCGEAPADRICKNCKRAYYGGEK